MNPGQFSIFLENAVLNIVWFHLARRSLYGAFDHFGIWLRDEIENQFRILQYFFRAKAE